MEVIKEKTQKKAWNPGVCMWEARKVPLAGKGTAIEHR